MRFVIILVATLFALAEAQQQRPPSALQSIFNTVTGRQPQYVGIPITVQTGQMQQQWYQEPQIQYVQDPFYFQEFQQPCPNLQLQEQQLRNDIQHLENQKRRADEEERIRKQKEYDEEQERKRKHQQQDEDRARKIREEEEYRIRVFQQQDQDELRKVREHEERVERLKEEERRRQQQQG